MKNFGFFILFVFTISCNKSIVWVNDKSEIASLKSRVSQLQYQIDSLRNAVAINNRLLLDQTDSLSLALTKANNTITQSNIAIASIVFSLDSIKSQLKTTLTQVTAINNIQVKTDSAISNNSTQLVALNQKYLDLLTRYNKILQLINDFPLNTISNGLLAYYPFTGNANDSSGFGNNGIVQGAILTNDRNNNANSAYNFIKSKSSYIALPLMSSINGAKILSFSFWVKTNSLSNSGTIFGHWSNNNGGVGINCGISIEQQATNSGIGIYNYSGTGGILTPSITQNAWHHFVINIDFDQNLNSNKVITYIDNKVSNPAKNITTFSNDLPVSENMPNNKWCHIPKFFSKSNAFVHTSCGNHLIIVSHGNEVNSQIGLLHFNNTGNRRFYERSKIVINGYKYFSTDLSIRVQIDILKNNKQNFGPGIHKVNSYHLMLLRMYILDLFITFIKRLPTVIELTFHSTYKINMGADDIYDEFKTCKECIQNVNLPLITFNHHEKNNLIFFDEPMSTLKDKYNVFENTYLSDLLKVLSNISP